MNEKECIKVRDLVVEYTSAGKVIHAVNGVSFSLKKGKTLALVGETGAGKTTIALSILRLIPNPPGRIGAGGKMKDASGLDGTLEKLGIHTDAGEIVIGQDRFMQRGSCDHIALRLRPNQIEDKKG